MKEQKQTEPKHFGKITFGAVLAVFLMWLAYAFLIDNFIPSQTDRGLFGDQFGALNTLFSGLAFAIIIVALFLQRKEFSAQLDEIRKTQKIAIQQAEALVKQEEVFQKQLETQKQQQIENTFFNILKFHTELVATLAIYHSGSWRKGREVFRSLANSVNDAKIPKSDRYLSLYSDFGANFHHYFQSIEEILSYIETCDASDNKKTLFRKILRAQLTSQEKMIINIHSSQKDKSDFNDLINRNGITN